MIQRLVHVGQCRLDVVEVHDDAGLVVGLAVDGSAHAEGVSVHPRIGMTGRRRRQEMCGLEGELFVDTHGSRLGDFVRPCQGGLRQP